MNITDDIVKKAQQGDEEAINKMIKVCSPLIYYLVARTLSGTTEAKDCTQVVMERVMNKLHYYDCKKTTFTTWFYIVVQRSIRSYKEQYERYRAMEINDGDDQEFIDVDENEFHKRRLSNVEEYVGEYYYHILMLRLGFELSFYEIAEELNIPYHKAKRDFHLAYNKSQEYVRSVKWVKK